MPPRLSPYPNAHDHQEGPLLLVIGAMFSIFRYQHNVYAPTVQHQTRRFLQKTNTAMYCYRWINNKKPSHLPSIVSKTTAVLLLGRPPVLLLLRRQPVLIHCCEDKPVHYTVLKASSSTITVRRQPVLLLFRRQPISKAVRQPPTPVWSLDNVGRLPNFYILLHRINEPLKPEYKPVRKCITARKPPSKKKGKETK